MTDTQLKFSRKRMKSRLPRNVTARWCCVVTCVFGVVGASLPSSLAQNNTIFDGGHKDGFAAGTFESAAGQNNAIFDGGHSDGFGSGSFETIHHNAIFAGGSSDGFSAAVFESELQPNGIFAGGAGDGFDSDIANSNLSPYSHYMLEAGVFGLHAAPLADIDFDGWVNLLEFAFGSHPAQGASAPDLKTIHADPGGGNQLILVYPRRIGGAEMGSDYIADGVIYYGQGTLLMIDWEEPVQHRPPPGSLPALPSGYEYGAISMPVISRRAFLRVTIQADE